MRENDLMPYANAFHLLQISKLNFYFLKECGNSCAAQSTALVNLLQSSSYFKYYQFWHLKILHSAHRLSLYVF